MAVSRGLKTLGVLLLASSAWGVTEQGPKDVTLPQPQAIPSGPALTPLSPIAIDLAAVPAANLALDPPALRPTEIPLQPQSPSIQNEIHGASGIGKVEEAPAAAPENSPPIEELASASAEKFDLAHFSRGAETFLAAPGDYRQGLAERRVPRVEIKGVVSLEGSSGAVFAGELDGHAIAVKTYGALSKEDWPSVVGYFRNEIAMAAAMSRVLGPKGMAPKSYGEVDIGERGNPSLGMELIKGTDPDRLTARAAVKLITPETIRQAAEGIRLLREAGLGGGDSPQPLVLTRDQIVNGVRRKAGDIVFMDAGGLGTDPKKWKAPEDEAQFLAFCLLRARELAATRPNELLGDEVLSAEAIASLSARAKKLVRAILKP